MTDSASELELNGSELLLLKWEMEGSTSEVGYKFSSDLQRADVRGDPDSQFITNRAISVLEEQGELRKIIFWVEYLDDPIDNDRYVQVRLYDDGHLTVSQEVQPELFDTIESHIERLRKYREYLKSIQEIQDEFMSDAFRTESSTRRERIRQQMIQSFDRVLGSYFSTEEHSDAELRVFRTIIANLGTEIIAEGVPHPNTIEGVTRTSIERLDTEMAEYGMKEFFIEYADHVQSNQSLDYETLIDHLHMILEINKDLDGSDDDYITWKKPLSVISDITERYDLE